MLKALELVGFKSFADRTRFEFPPGITVIVGPNGSGKSNIVDGIKWVLGEQSAKSLRGKDMADVIFKGAGAGDLTRKPLHSAEATIILENRARDFEYDADEIHVTRRVYRSGEGEYLINGDPCRLKDIREMFRGTGVATDAYGLIEQGKVDQMLQASPKDRRAIFEEAAGISRFKAKKVEAQRRLARVDQNLLRLSDIVEEVERRFRSIKAQASKATRYQESNERLKVLRTSLGWADTRRFSSRLDEIASEQNQLEAALQQGTHKLSELESRQQSTESDAARLATELSGAEAALSDLRERIAVRESAASHLLQRADELAVEFDRTGRRLFECRNRSDALAERVGKAQAKADEAELAYRELADQLQRLETKDRQLAETIESSQTANTERAEQSRILAQSVTTLEKEISVETSRVDESRKVRAKIVSQLDTLRLDCEELDSELSELRIKQQRLELDAENKDSALAEAKSTLEATRVSLAERQEQLADLKSERSGAMRRAEVIEELEQKLEGVHAGVRQLIEQSRVRRQGSSSDVVGLVADLIQVEVENASLIDVALGDVSQHVVIEGQTLLGELIDGSLQLGGRVGLIRLDELNSSTARDTAELHGDDRIIGCAADMVQTQPAYETLKRHVLGNTWVVNSLADALELKEQISRKDHLARAARFVTLTGQLLEADGTVIAGPRTRTGGLVSRRSELRSLKAQIDRLGRKVDATTLEVVELQQAVADQEANVETIIDEHGELAAELSDHRMMAGSLQQKLDAARQQIREQMEEAQGLAERIDHSERSLLENQTECAAQKSKLEQLEKESQLDTEKIQSAGRERQTAADELTRAKVELAKAEQLLETIQGRLQQDNEELSRQQAEYRSLDDQLVSCSSRATETRHERLEATSDLALLYLSKQQLATRVREAMEQSEQQRRARRELGSAVETQRDRVHQTEQSLHRLELERGQLDQERQSILSRLRDDYGIEVDQISPSPDWDEGRNRDEIDSEIQTLKRKINSMGAVNLEALNELNELEARFGALNAQYRDLSSAKETLSRIIDRINADSRKLFSDTLEAIRANFQTLYRRSFGGGRADLVLEEGVDILEAGIDIIATPPGKPEFNNSLLSGGEKALTAVALLLAIFQYRPSPFCVLDEVDAPFDEANIGRFIEVLNGFLDRTRFVIVTHSKKTMTAATTLYGVTMEESGVSKRVSVRFEDVSEDGHISGDSIDQHPGEEAGGAARAG